MVKKLPAMQETWAQSLGQEDPWRRKWQPTPVFLPGEFHGQRSLLSYSSWGCKELDMTVINTFTDRNLLIISNRIKMCKDFPLAKSRH